MSDTVIRLIERRSVGDKYILVSSRPSPFPPDNFSRFRLEEWWPPVSSCLLSYAISLDRHLFKFKNYSVIHKYACENCSWWINANLVKRFNQQSFIQISFSDYRSISQRLTNFPCSSSSLSFGLRTRSTSIETPVSFFRCYLGVLLESQETSLIPVQVECLGILVWQQAVSFSLPQQGDPLFLQLLAPSVSHGKRQQHPAPFGKKWHIVASF